uniref:G domain-containing protein n=1 Tax=Oncorhynchus kisutch TaxID=8019 RepID=A0A8C7CVN7_ONCKI
NHNYIHNNLKDYDYLTKRKDVDGRDGVRRWTIGNNNPCKRNKTLLILGEVGAGKTTLVNAMVNFAIRVKWEDNARFQITECFKDRETCWAHDPRTNAVTAYEIFGWEDAELPFSLTIIDTPGIEDRDGLRPLIEKLRMLLEEERVDHIDAVCHVVKATQNRLTEHQRNIFDAFLSLLGKDMKDNIITLITHSDETRPEVLDIIMEYKLLGDKVPIVCSTSNYQENNTDQMFSHFYSVSFISCI